MAVAEAVHTKGFGSAVVLEVFLNGCFEFGDALEHAATDLIAGDQAEEAFDLAEPGGGCRSEVHMEARMFCVDLGMLVGGVVVGDQMQVSFLGVSASIRRRNFSSWRCRFMQWPMTLPVATSSAANNVVVGACSHASWCRLGPS